MSIRWRVSPSRTRRPASPRPRRPGVSSSACATSCRSPRPPHRVVLSTLEGVTPELLGEYVERTPPPPARPSPGEPARTDAAAAAAPAARLGAGRRAARPPSQPPSCSSAPGVWWFAIRDTEPTLRPGAVQRPRLGPDWELENALDELRDREPTSSTRSRRSGTRSPGVDRRSSPTPTPDEERRPTSSSPRRATAASRSSPRCTTRTAPGVMAAMLADPESAGRPHRRDRRLRRRARLPGHRHQLRELRLQRRPGHVGDDTPELGDVHRGARRPPPRRRAAAHRQRAAGRTTTGRPRTAATGCTTTAAIAPHVDAIRVMAYDYSVADPGPIAPLDWVEELIDGSHRGRRRAGEARPRHPAVRPQLGDRHERRVPRRHAADGTEPRLNAIEDLIERRDAEPIYNEETGEWSFTYQVDLPRGRPACTQTREVHYVDAEARAAADADVRRQRLARRRRCSPSATRTTRVWDRHRRDQRHVGDGARRQRRTDDHRGADDHRRTDDADHGGRPPLRRRLRRRRRRRPAPSVSVMRVHLVDGTYELFRQHFGRMMRDDPRENAATIGVLQVDAGAARRGRHPRRRRQRPRHRELPQRPVARLQVERRDAAGAARPARPRRGGAGGDGRDGVGDGRARGRRRPRRRGPRRRRRRRGRAGAHPHPRQGPRPVRARPAGRAVRPPQAGADRPRRRRRQVRRRAGVDPRLPRARRRLQRRLPRSPGVGRAQRRQRARPATDTSRRSPRRPGSGTSPGCAARPSWPPRCRTTSSWRCCSADSPRSSPTSTSAPSTRGAGPARPPSSRRWPNGCRRPSSSPGRLRSRRAGR